MEYYIAIKKEQTSSIPKQFKPMGERGRYNAECKKLDRKESNMITPFIGS